MWDRKCRNLLPAGVSLGDEVGKALFDCDFVYYFWKSDLRMQGLKMRHGTAWGWNE